MTRLVDSEIDSVDALLAFVQRPDIDSLTLWYAADLLKESGDHRAGTTLARVIAGSREELMYSAAFHLSSIRGGRGNRTLISVLQHSKSDAARTWAAYVLGLRRSRAAAGPLLAVLREPSNPPRLRGQAAEALGYIHWRKGTNVPEAVDALLLALRDEDATLRQDAAFALGQIGDRRALPELERLPDIDYATTTLSYTVADIACYAIRSLNNEWEPNDA